MGSTQSKNDQLKDIIIELHQLEAIKFGEFKLKSGIMSPVYFDLRVMVSEPKLMAKISRIMWDTYADNKSGPKAQLICGVPYTASGPAYLISLDQNIPSIIKRKEKKEYGTKKMLEGKFEVGQNCLIIEDVISSGASVLETAEVLKSEKLKVTDVVVFLDREQGGSTNLKVGKTQKDISNLAPSSKIFYQKTLKFHFRLKLLVLVSCVLWLFFLKMDPN